MVKSIHNTAIRGYIVLLTLALLVQAYCGSGDEQSQFDFANGLYTRRFFKEAIEEYQKFIRDYPNSPNVGEALLRLGKSALMEKQYDTAIMAFDQAIAKLSEPDKIAEATVRKGECLYYVKRWAECVEVLREYTQPSVSPELRSRALFFYARALVQMQNYEMAIAPLQEFIQSYPEHSLTPLAQFVLGNVFAQTNQVENAVALMAELASKEGVDPDLRIESQFRAGELYAQLGWFSESVNAYAKLRDLVKEGPYRVKADYGYAWGLYQAKRFEECIHACREFLEKHPQAENRPQVMYMLGNSLLEQNKLSEAMQQYQTLRTEFPNSPSAIDALYKIGWIKYLNKDYAGAKSDVLTFLEKGEQSPLRQDASFLLGSLYAIEGNYEDAIEEFQWVWEKHPNSTYADESLYKSAECAESLGLVQSAIQWYERFVQTYPNHSLTGLAWLRLGNLYQKQNDWAKAIACYQQAKSVVKEPNLEEQVLYRLIAGYEQVGNYEEASSLYKEYMQKFPNTPTSFEMTLRLAKYYLKDKSDPVNAVDVLTQLLSSNPPKEVAGRGYYLLGMSYYELKRYNESAETFLKILQQYPEVEFSEEQFAWLAQFYLDAQQWREAEIVLKRMMEVLKGYPAPQRLQFRYAECLENQQRLDEAIAEYQKVVSMSPNSTSAVEALYRIAQIYERRNQIDSAIEFYEQCANQGGSETCAKAQFRVAEILQGRGELERAGKNYLKVAILFLHPELSPEALWRASECYVSIRDFARAKTALTELMNDFPTHPLSEKAQNMLNKLTVNTGPLEPAL